MCVKTEGIKEMIQNVDYPIALEEVVDTNSPQ